MKIRLMRLFFWWILLKKSANKFFYRPKTINFVLTCRDDAFLLTIQLFNNRLIIYIV